MGKLREKLRLPVPVSHLSQIAREKLGYAYKKDGSRSEQNRPDVQAGRKLRVEEVVQTDAKQLISLDESGINSSMTRR